MPIVQQRDNSCRLATTRHDAIQMKSGRNEPNYEVLSTMMNNASLRRWKIEPHQTLSYSTPIIQPSSSMMQTCPLDATNTKVRVLSD